MAGTAWRGAAWPGKAWQAWQGQARQGEVRQARRGKTWHGTARHGRQGGARQGEAWFGRVWQAGQGLAWQGVARPGTVRQAWQGVARQGQVRQARERPVTLTLVQVREIKKGFVMAFAKKDESVAVVKAANIVRTTLRITGTAPLVQLKFSEKAKAMMMKNMATPAAEKKSKSVREARDYDADYVGAQHISVAGWNGMPCAAFRSAMIDACRTVGLVMTKAKMAVFVVPDGFDAHDGTPLVKILNGSPERFESLVRNDNGGADVRIRAMWREWEMDVTVEFDADMISAESVVNLLDRAGRQVGIGEGRPFSKNSVGQGWGTFTVKAGK
jgi:hypothetical protein